MKQPVRVQEASEIVRRETGRSCCQRLRETSKLEQRALKVYCTGRSGEDPPKIRMIQSCHAEGAPQLTAPLWQGKTTGVTNAQLLRRAAAVHELR